MVVENKGWQIWGIFYPKCATDPPSNLLLTQHAFICFSLTKNEHKVSIKWPYHALLHRFLKPESVGLLVLLKGLCKWKCFFVWMVSLNKTKCSVLDLEKTTWHNNVLFKSAMGDKHPPLLKHTCTQQGKQGRLIFLHCHIWHCRPCPALVISVFSPNFQPTPC